MNNDSEQQPYQWRQKWGDDYFAQRGFVSVPSALVEYAGELGIEPAEGWLICCILYWKWTAEPPYPSIAHIAKAVNRSENSVRRYLDSLEEKGLIRVIPSFDETGRQTSNLIDFEPLREKINELGRFELPAWAHDGQRILAVEAGSQC